MEQPAYVNPVHWAEHDFQAMIHAVAQPVWWVSSSPCSCYGRYRQVPDRALTYDPECPLHDEDGYVYTDAVWITGSILQKMRQDMSYVETGQQILGTAEWLVFPTQMDGSPNPAYTGISDHDLIIAAEAVATFTDPVPIGQTTLRRPIVRILDMRYQGQSVDPALYRVEQGKIQWSPSLLALSGVVSVTWQYHPIYTLLTALPSMRVFAEQSWPRRVALQERSLMGYRLWRALWGKVPGWDWMPDPPEGSS